MKIRFSTRAIFVVMTIVAAYLGMIVWTQSKASGFAEAMNKSSARVATKLLSDSSLLGRQDFCLGSTPSDPTEILNPTLADLFLLRRTCVVEFKSCDAGNYFNNRIEYRVRIFENTFERSWQIASAVR